MRLISPVFFKELGQIASSRRSIILKCIFLCILLLFYLIVIASIGRVGNGLEIFGTVSFVLLTAVVLFTPLVTAGVICGEKQAGTLGLLFITRLTALNIVQDKGLSRITYMMYIALLTFPFMFGALLYGGIELRQIIAVMGNVIGAILFCGGLSLLASTVFKKFSAALAVVYTFLLAYYLFASLLIANFGNSPMTISHFNPFVSVGMVLSGQFMRTGWAAHTWIGNLALGAVVYVLCLAFSALTLRKVAFAGDASDAKRKAWNIPKAFTPSRWFTRGDRPGANPMIWKESMLSQGHLRKVLLGLALLLFAGYIATLIGSDVLSQRPRRQGEFHTFMYGLAFCITGVYTILLATSSFSREREGKTFDVLLSTRLSGRQVVQGMFWGNFRALLVFLGMTLLIAAIGAFGAERPYVLAWVVLNMVVYLGGLIILCMYYSLIMSSTAKAIGFSIGTALATFFLPLMFGLLTQDGDVMQAMFALTPEAWIISTYLPYNDLMDEIGGYAAYLVITAVYAVIGTVLWINMSEQFDRIVGRQETNLYTD